MKTCSHCGASIDSRGLKAHELKCGKTSVDSVSSVGDTSKDINLDKYAVGEQSPQCDSDNTLLRVGAVVSIGAGLLALSTFLKKVVRGA